MISAFATVVVLFGKKTKKNKNSENQDQFEVGNVLI